MRGPPPADEEETMAVLGEATKFHHKYRFQVQIEDFAHARFQNCSELSAEIAKIEHWEGGALIPYKEPGRMTFTDITLERGVTVNRDLYNWFLETSNAVKNAGRIMPRFKRNLDIVQRGRNGSVRRRWTLLNAWPTKFVAGEWANDDDGVVIESVTLTYDIFKRPED